MRLFTRLLISHSAPLLVVTCALALTLVALLRMTAVLDALGHDELGTLQREGELHRSAWALDVAMRHGHDDCMAERATPTRARIEGDVAELGLALELFDTRGAMAELVERYLELAAELLDAKDVCAVLTRPSYQEQRSLLDEELTNIWVARLDELHAEVTRKDEEARQIGTTAAFAGMVLAASSLLLAALVAGRLARIVNQPLTSLAEITRRVGRGDFSTPVAIEGPIEMIELADELERMRLQLEQLETLKQGILASISHELRTPLSKIREALALLADGVVGALDPRQTQVVQIAREACEREIRMVTTLLDLSRLRAGSPVRVRDGSSLDSVLESAVQDERADADTRGVIVRLELVGDSPAIQLDHVLIERTVANLVRNAVAVSSPGQEVVVHREVLSGPDVAAARASLAPSWACVTVRDHGPGVPAEIRETVFDAFVTRAVPRSPKGLGFGLGLALAREVARAHGGDLELDEPSGDGATFRLWLPLGDRTGFERRKPPRSLGLEPTESEELGSHARRTAD
jgi:two-component system, NtrC family, sensor histidine kinase GlrK